VSPIVLTVLNLGFVLVSPSTVSRFRFLQSDKTLASCGAESNLCPLVFNVVFNHGGYIATGKRGEMGGGKGGDGIEPLVKCFLFTKDKDRPASGWLPNHFVVCLPDETQGTPRKRPAGTDIRSFFTKFPKSDN
jgi:hypothetical protein